MPYREEGRDTLQLADIMTKGVKQPQWEMCMVGLLGKPLVPSIQTVVAQEGDNTLLPSVARVSIQVEPRHA